MGVSVCVRGFAPAHPAVAPCSALNPAFPHPSPLPEGEGTVPPRKRRVFALSGGSTNALLPPLPLGEGWGEGFLETGGCFLVSTFCYIVGIMPLPSFALRFC